jgi:Na+-transporting methylmalonyl-CoA/oxaloacetate decarboxylase gamma subunit
MTGGGEMTTAEFFIFVSPFVGTILLVFAIRAVSQIVQARARIAAEDKYRSLAEKSLAAQTGNETALAAIRADLSKVSASLAAVETILKQVD